MKKLITYEKVAQADTNGDIWMSEELTSELLFGCNNSNMDTTPSGSSAKRVPRSSRDTVNLIPVIEFPKIALLTANGENVVWDIRHLKAPQDFLVRRRMNII